MPLSGIILAGGRSSRMGGRDKALLRLGGATLIQRAVDRLAPQVDRLLLSANGDAARFGLDGIEVVADADDSRAGPLAGILAGLRRVAPPGGSMVSVAVDTPFFPRDLGPRLAAAAAATPGAVAVATSAGMRHPTFALWPAGLAEALAAYLAGGGHRAGAFIDAQPHVAVDFPAIDGFDPFFNVNTPEDLAEAERIEKAAPMR